MLPVGLVAQELAGGVEQRQRGRRIDPGGVIAQVADQEVLAVGRELDAGGVAQAQDVDDLAGREVPDPQRVIAAQRRQQVSVSGEGHGAHAIEKGVLSGVGKAILDAAQVLQMQAAAIAQRDEELL